MLSHSSPMLLRRSLQKWGCQRPSPEDIARPESYEHLLLIQQCILHLKTLIQAGLLDEVDDLRLLAPTIGISIEAMWEES